MFQNVLNRSTHFKRIGCRLGNDRRAHNSRYRITFRCLYKETMHRSLHNWSYLYYFAELNPAENYLVHKPARIRPYFWLCVCISAHQGPIFHSTWARGSGRNLYALWIWNLKLGSRYKSAGLRRAPGSEVSEFQRRNLTLNIITFAAYFYFFDKLTPFFGRHTTTRNTVIFFKNKIFY
jgi:hypothetical protein